MTFNQINILSGPVRSGKTTSLMKWLEGRDDAGGILTPDVEGVRFLYDVARRERHPFELAGEPMPGEPVVEIGRFRFYQSAFEQARRILLRDLEAAPAWLIIDEIGKLELKGEGLEPAAGLLISRYRDGNVTGKLLLVVRDYLLEEVREHYQLLNDWMIE
jgi:nucleoside-triphosphatase